MNAAITQTNASKRQKVRAELEKATNIDSKIEDKAAEIEETAKVIIEKPDHHPVLKKMLASITDKLTDDEFRNISGNSLTTNPGRSDYYIGVIEKVLEKARSLKLGLCGDAVENSQNIYCYTGEYWQRLTEGQLRFFLQDCAEKLGVSKYAKDHKFVESLYKQFLSQAYPPVVAERDPNKILINLMNGTFEISTESPEGRLRPFQSKDFLKYQMPFKYDPSATCSMWQNFLDEMQPDEKREGQRLLAEVMAFPLVYFKIEKAIFMYGTGANGKGVYYEIQRRLYGKENVSDCSLTNLKQEYYLSDLNGKLVNYSSELGSAGMIESDLFKQLASREPVKARQKYGKSFTMYDYARLIFNANELPSAPEMTTAFFRRFLIIPWEVTQPENKQDVELPEKIAASELPGIFNWTLQGLKRLVAQKRFSECEASAKALDRYKQDSDNTAQFLDDCGYEDSPDAWTDLKTLHREYTEYCRDSGYKPLGRNKFSQRLERNKHLSKHIDNKRGFCLGKK